MSERQAPTQTDSQRFDALPPTLIRYARDLEEHGRPMDSGLSEILRFIAGQITKQVQMEERGEGHSAAIARATEEDAEFEVKHGCWRERS